MLKNKYGITLIALVITIIVLLILAGVTIAMLTGENGILNKANYAKQENVKATIDEKKKLAVVEAVLNTSETEYTDKNNETVKIPAECAPTRIEGEDTLEKGLAIIDKNANSWVWIQIPKSILPEGLTFQTDDSLDYELLETALHNYAKDYRGSYKDIWYDSEGKTAENSSNLEDSKGCGLTNNQYIQAKKSMLKSIYNNGGFWISQYEIGSENYVLNNAQAQRKAVSKEGMYPYNYVTCSQAQEQSSKMSIGNRTTTLLFGIQWDLVCKVIEEKGILEDGTKVTKDMVTTDSQKWGNYYSTTFNISKGKYILNFKEFYQKVNGSYSKPQNKSVVLTTGCTDRNKMLNIYDLAGNVWERTLEYTRNSTYPCVFRGASGLDYPSNLTEFPVKFRSVCHATSGAGVNYNSANLGFRTTLY